MAKNEMASPGTPLAFSEEFLPGHGTYDDGTQIRAAVFGMQHVDPETMTLSVVPAGKKVATIEKGDIVVGQITFIKPEALASVKIQGVRGKEGRSIHLSVDATLHVSKIDNRYIQDVTSEYHRGDIIRAKVLGLKGGPQLATDRPELGCIKAWSTDGNELVLDGNRLRDPETGRVENRKLASDYGSGQV